MNNMAIFLEFESGESQGKQFPLKQGTKLGRTQGEILIKDVKASSLHAEVQKDEKGQLILVDRNSTNGIKVNGQKVPKLALLPGIRCQVGDTFFKIIEIDDPPVVDMPTAKFEVTELLVEKEPEPTNWAQALSSEVPKIPGENKNNTGAVQAFFKAVQLDFLQGVQAETKVVLGYGPRCAGSEVLDIELQDPLAPDLAFELLPENDQVLFQTDHPKLVLLNDKSVSSEVLKAGDRIRIGASLIEVQFLE